MSTLAAIPEQPRAIAVLHAALERHSVHHAYLFAGPAGVGKERTAIALAQALLCPLAPDVGCGVCSSCQRVSRLSHPDMPWLMPEDEQVRRNLKGRSDFDHVPSREIRVDQVRTLQARVVLRGLESRRKVVLVVGVERMNVQAQNAFLKTLEEPPADTVMVLVCSAPDRLLPTLLSRCVRVQFAPLSVDYLAGQLELELKLTPELARTVAALAGGSLERALALDVKRLSSRKELFEAFEGVKAEDLRTVLRFAETWGSTREDAEESLELLLVWTRDVMLARAGEGTLANADLSDFAREVAARRDDTQLHQRQRALSRALNAISVRNGSARLQVERMMLELVEGRA